MMMLVIKLTFILISFISVKLIACDDNFTSLVFEDNIFSLSEPEVNHTDSSFESFIVNGRDASKGEYPWYATISIIKGNYISTICGGTFINRNWVLTAAHCIDRLKYGVEVGKYKSGIRAAYRNVDYVCRHKFYNQATIDNDIALLHFPYPITNIKPIRFTNPQTDKFNVIGFGSTNVNAAGGYPTTLQEATVYTVDQKKCEHKWGDYIDNRKICATGYGKQDSCVGDSGGPLVVKTSNGIKQVGLVSFGPVPCNDKDYPVIYTRLKPMQSWINRVISGDNSQCTIIK